MPAAGEAKLSESAARILVVDDIPQNVKLLADLLGVKGFAVTLVIGVLASMFTAITVSRAIVTLVYARRKKLKSLAI